MNTTTATTSIDPADLIAAHVAAATAPLRLVATPDPAAVARWEAQQRFDAEGLPRMVMPLEAM